MSVDIDREQMKELPRGDTVEPFTKINYWDKPDGSSRVIQAFIPLEKPIEGAKMGLAIDGSGSMEKLFGRPQKGIIPGTPNDVRPVARLMSAYLTKKARAIRLMLSEQRISSSYEIRMESHSVSLSWHMSWGHRLP